MKTYTVTQKIKITKQPWDGYLPPSYFEVTKLSDNKFLHEVNKENYLPTLVGTAIDYLTRLFVNKDVNEAFQISLFGFVIYLRNFEKNEVKKVIWKERIFNILETLEKTKNPSELDEEKIRGALLLCNFDQVYRANKYYPFKNEQVNNETIFNIKVMVARSLAFFKKYGPVIKYGFTFDDQNDKTKNGYSKVVVNGDGDFLTKDTLWDFKVSKYDPSINNTLQLLMYFIMGKQSQLAYYQNIEYVGIFNPRLNKVYKFKVSNLDQKIIAEIQKNVIEYENY